MVAVPAWWLCAGASAWASAGESPPQDVVFTDLADVFSSLMWDTGYLPGASDPIAIRLYLTPTGGVDTELHGASEIEWPPLAHRVASRTGGWVSLDTDIAIGAEVKLDLLGIFTGVVPLVTQTVSLHASQDVDGLLLPGHPTAEVALTVDDPGALPPIGYTLPVIAGVDLVASVAIVPDAVAVVRGVAVDSVIGDDALVQDSEAVWTDLPPDPERPGELGVVSTWQGEVDATLTAVITPEVRVDTLLGAFTLAQFPIPVTLVDTSSVRTSSPVFSVHPMPVLAGLADADGHGFGGVPVGELANWSVPLDNLGEMLLEATLRVDGDGFDVWPPALAAGPTTDAGFVVTFAPTAVGPHAGSLVIETNDPTMPLLAIPLAGVGVDVASDAPQEGDPFDDGGGTISTCGCAPIGAGAPGWQVVAVGLGFSAARRRSRPGGASRTSGPRPRR